MPPHPKTKFITLLCLLFSAQFSLAQQPVKVHKDKIIVTPPDPAGQILVTGLPGAVTTDSQTTLQLIHLPTKIKVPMPLAPDGSFSGRIDAQPGEKIKVLAKNQQGRQSYGTFPVPAIASPASTPPPTIPTTITSAPSGSTLTVLITVIDPATNQILQTRLISVHSSENHAAGLAQKILDQCDSAIHSMQPAKTDSLPPRTTEIPPENPHSPPSPPVP